jgi:ferredoxin--NADP+ reductase
MTELQTMRTSGVPGYEVLVNERLSATVHRLVVSAPRVAAAGRPGQFVIVRLGEGAERIPLTIAERHPEAGTIALVVQAVGKSTNDLTALPPGSTIHDVAGPLGRPSELVAHGRVVCVGGGVGAAVMLPIARGLAELGAGVVTVVGARTGADVIYRDEFAALGELIVCTDDGSAGRTGLVTDALTDILDACDGGDGDDVTAVYAAGPVPMMRAVAAITRPVGVRTIVSLNPIMVDGTGMCGGCRVTVDGTMRFACVDGPEFDARGVDFDELADRLGTYRELERASVGDTCRSAR